ncbi:V-type ATP synthase subunit A [Myxococcota bacterium]|nr:V-type ATP synthase subunit A [Myxococcota bacterium]MBU1380187.1 V-type ATP synthase subunit A [Myxococcota bacterium]MBU1497337.1 V-type ATP synthase subunit A [Myxococcota bacterium]
MIVVEIDQGSVIQNEVAFVTVSDMKLKAEVIKVVGKNCYLQVFEDTTGIGVGMKVDFTGNMLAVELGPGLLGSIYDGLQNPLGLLDNKQGFFLQRGQYKDPLSREKTWEFKPVVKVGDKVRGGQWIGEVKENFLTHRIITPIGMHGIATVKEIVSEGTYKITDTIAKIEVNGKVIPLNMFQDWPVKKAIKAYRERIYPEELLITKQRIIDTTFPVARGGTACIPGPFGAGKTVLQHLMSKYSSVDVVIVVACGERAGEVVELIHEFPEITDPKTGGSLMDRTIIICNTSSMPVAAREASVYTGITLAEYYRQMGLDVLVLADSTSRWAQAMREMSGRLEEIPGEEAFPAYLESRIAGLYERAGLVTLHNGEKGAVTLIGTVSPAGGNFEEPVTQATLKVVGAFLGLSRKRSDERKFPAIDPLDSYSLYIEQMESSLNRDLDRDWTKMVSRSRDILRAGAEVGKMMTVVGEEGISLDDLVMYLKSELLDFTYLQQNAFDDVDCASDIERQVVDFKLLYRALTQDFKFNSKPEARQFFTTLQDKYYQRNYYSPDSDEFKKLVGEIEESLVSGGNSLV